MWGSSWYELRSMVKSWQRNDKPTLTKLTGLLEFTWVFIGFYSVPSEHLISLKLS